MALDFTGKDDSNAHDPNIDASLTLNPPQGLSSSAVYESPSSAAGLMNLDSSQVLPENSSFTSLTGDPSAQPDQPQQSTQLYTPAKLFQATGDVRNLTRSDTSPSG